MSVSLEPSSQLSFRKPFTQLVRQSLAIHNPHEQPIAFKVKTTAPKLYCVRPNSGKVQPGESVEVSVLLQPMKEDPPLSLKCKDKFLVQSTLIPYDKENLNANDFWTSVAGDDHVKISQQKLRVAYLPAEGALQEEDEHELNQASILSEGDSHLNRYQTVRQHNGHAGDGIGIPVFDNEPRNSLGAGSGTPPRAHTPDGAEFANAHEQQTHEAHEQQHIVTAPTLPPPIISPSSTAQVGIGSMSTTIPRVSYDHNAEYAAKLAEANAEIARLKAVLANSNALGVPTRRRPVFSDDGTSVQDGVTDAGLDDSASVIGTATRPDGVPLNVVAMVSVLVFIVTYLFF